MPIRYVRGIVPLAILLLLALSARADQTERVRFAASLTAGYLLANTDEVVFLDEHGDARLLRYSLLIDMAASDRLTLETEVFGETVPMHPTDDLAAALQGRNDQPTSMEPELLQAAGTYRLSDSLDLRAGIIRAPIGQYGILRDVGIFHRIIHSSLYDAKIGIVPRNFRGLLLRWRDDLGPLGETALEVWGGEMTTPFAIVLDPTPTRLRNLTGANLSVRVASWLKVNASGWIGHDYESDAASDQYDVWLVGLELGPEWLQFGSEFAQFRRESEAMYASIDWRPSDWFSAFYSWESAWQNPGHKGANAIGLLWGDAHVVGIDLRPSPLFSFKLEDHMTRGSMFTGGFLQPLADPDQRTHLILAAVSIAYY